MIHCLPVGFCSRNSYVVSESHSALCEVGGVRSGAITSDGVCHAVVYHRILSGRWTLEREGVAIATAQKLGRFTSWFKLWTEQGTLELRPTSWLGGPMVLAGAGFDATIAPVHGYTRSSTIVGATPDFTLAVFAFWLTINK
jgi:hypothetical protein